MRLIHAQTLVEQGYISFEEFDNSNVPQYAILSHTWETNQEIIFGDCKSPLARSKVGYNKILKTCEEALSEAIDYVWVDTCCIDKSSSAELTEAINSMFVWYQKAKICYAYLVDVFGNEPMEGARWFRRGWTLQELIAPKSMVFFNNSWQRIGTKTNLVTKLSEITSISKDVLRHKSPLSSIGVAKRLSWAADRKTTRVEDTAYCLLGILEINMPTLYGEGERAFYRLQEEIVRSRYDLSLLAWTPKQEQGNYCGFFAKSPNDFAACSTLEATTDAWLDEGEMAITNKGLKIKACISLLVFQNDSIKAQYAIQLHCNDSGLKKTSYIISMRKIGPNIFIRTRHAVTGRFITLSKLKKSDKQRELILLTKLPRTVVPGTIVSSRRHTLVKVELQEVNGYHGIPNKCFDAQDFAFLGSSHSLSNWGALEIGNRIIFICFWYRRDKNWRFHGGLLDLQHEDASQVQNTWEFLYRFTEEFEYTADSVRDEFHATQQYDRIANALWDSGGQRLLTCSFQREDDPLFCSGPRWIVQIKRELALNDDAAQNTKKTNEEPLSPDW